MKEARPELYEKLAEANKIASGEIKGDGQND